MFLLGKDTFVFSSSCRLFLAWLKTWQRRGDGVTVASVAVQPFAVPAVGQQRWLVLGALLLQLMSLRW